MSNLVNVKSVSENDIRKMLLKFLEDETIRDLNFGSGYKYGIYYNDNLVGLLELSAWYPNNLALTIAILKEYRGKGIAVDAINIFVFEFGKFFPNNAKFIYNVSPKNTSSIRVAQKLDWEETSEFDDAMIEEGGEFFCIYYKNNPYYLNMNERKLK